MKRIARLPALAAAALSVVGCPPPGGDDDDSLGGGDEPIADVGTFLRTLVARDASYGELDALYSIEDSNDGQVIRLPLSGGDATELSPSFEARPRSLWVEGATAWWHDGGTFYWAPTGGGEADSLSVGSYVIQGLGVADGASIYFDEFITDRFMSVSTSGGEPVEVDLFPLGGTRSIARDASTVYWIGAIDGSSNLHLKSMSLSGGPQSSLLSGADIYMPAVLKAIPEDGGTTLYWLDILDTGNDVVRRFPLPSGPVTSVMNAPGILDFEVSDGSVFWSATENIIGRFDLAAQTFSYPVQGTSIEAFETHGGSLYWTTGAGRIFRQAIE